MDKLVLELISLLQRLLVAQQKLLDLSTQRKNAMAAFDIEGLNAILANEERHLQLLATMEIERKALIEKFRPLMGRFQPTVTEIARRCPPQQKEQLLGLAATVRDTVEKLDRLNRINHRITQAVLQNISKVAKIVTGLATHAGLYTPRGIKAPLRGVHTLDLAG